MAKRKAVVLLSGGLDSAVTLAVAKKLGYECYCLSLRYGQKHAKEIGRAALIAKEAGAHFTAIALELPWNGSSLLDRKIRIPTGRSPASIRRGGIPSTYVPGRNTIFLSMASSYAEAIGATEIFIGAHVEDSSGYPDCRPEYLSSFGSVIKTGTRAGLEGRLRLRYPLVNKSKSQIIRLGRQLGAPLVITWSCYHGGQAPCGKCDSCILRAKGFAEAGIEDPAYV